MQKSTSDWKRHARLLGEITERVALILSNTTKQKILDSIEEIDKQAKRDYYLANKEKKTETVPSEDSEKTETWGI